jgi:hypothetical protein
MVEIGGKQEKLIQGPKDEAHRQLAEEKFVELRKLMRLTPESVNSRTADVIEAFLRHSRLHFAPDTHRMNRYYCQIFAEACGQVLARDIKPLHVQRMIDDRVDLPFTRATGFDRRFPRGKNSYRRCVLQPNT